MRKISRTHPEVYFCEVNPAYASSKRCEIILLIPAVAEVSGGFK